MPNDETCRCPRVSVTVQISREGIEIEILCTPCRAGALLPLAAVDFFNCRSLMFHFSALRPIDSFQKFEIGEGTLEVPAELPVPQ